MPLVYDTVLNPYDPDDIVKETKQKCRGSRFPFTQAQAGTPTLQAAPAGARQWFQEVHGGVPKGLLITGPASGAAVSFLP
jgi:hypothetical protein